MYSLLITLFSCQLITIACMICINLVQFCAVTAFSKSVKYAHNFSSISEVHSDIILSIPPVSLAPLPPPPPKSDKNSSLHHICNYELKRKILI